MDEYGTANKAALYTANMIDVTEFSGLAIEGRNLDNITIGITESNNSAAPTFVASSNTTELDLSSVSGSYYVCVAATYATSAKITKICLV
jgi:hypothetical protein